MKTKIKFLAMMLMGVMLSTNVWGEYIEKSGFTATSGDINEYLSYASAKAEGTNPPFITTNNYIRLYRKSSENVGLGGTLTVTPGSGVTITEVVFHLNIEEQGYSYKIDGGSATTGSSSNNVVTITGISATTSVMIQNNSTSQMDITQIDITYTTTPAVTHEVTWHVGGATTTDQVAEGRAVVFPANPETPISCGTKVFTGWTNAPYESASVPPTYYKSATMETSDLDFYAVFADVSGNANEYVRVTSNSDLKDGMSVVLVSNKYSTALTHTSTPGLSYASAPTESSSKITATDAMKWTLEASNGKWLIKYGTYTLGSTALPNSTSGNNSKSLSFTSSNNTWTSYQNSKASNSLSFSNGSNSGLEAPSSSGNWVVYYNTNIPNNEYYALKVYKANVSYSNYVTSCATYNVTWKVNGAVYEEGGSTTAPGGGKVSALPTAPMPAGGCTGSTFMGWTDHEVLDGEAPTPLFKTVAEAPVVTDNVTYHAVFADEND